MELTAQSVIEKVQRELGVPWKNAPADTVLAGSPATAVTGIATTWTPTLDVLKRAIAAKHNLIFTRESPFWTRGASIPGYSGGGGAPKPEDLRSLPTYAAKADL